MKTIQPSDNSLMLRNTASNEKGKFLLYMEITRISLRDFNLWKVFKYLF